MARKISYIVATISLLLAGVVSAQESLHCKGKIIDVGMSMEVVRKHCGNPDSSSVDNQAVHAGSHVSGTTPVTTWRYKQPGGQIFAVLVFDVDKLLSIEYVGK